MHLRAFALGTFFFTPLLARSEVRLPNLISEHAVLQRQRPIHVWGTASPKSRLVVRFHDQQVRAEADRLGKWSIYLTPEKAGGPYKLSIDGDGSSLTVGDLLVGDVWLASGQSNMEMPLAGFRGSAVVKDSAKEIASANHPSIRLMFVEHTPSGFPLDDVTHTWTVCTPETARSFSAVAYFFGQEIADREKVPIGLIDSTWGGTPADPWVSMDTLGTDENLLPAFAARAKFIANLADRDRMIAAEKAEDDAARAAGKPLANHPWKPLPASYEPASLYNGMIAPLTPLAIKGFLWYQGETNSSPDRVPYYSALMTALIRDWRQHFAQGNLPFLFVQISSFTSPDERWGSLRDQQRRVLATAGTAMAVSLDVGLADNVHPPDKQTVAARLALAARNMVYGEKVTYEGPMFREATTERDSSGTSVLRVWFDHGEGLSFHGQPAVGFEIAGEDHRFVAATARIDGPSVAVTASGIAEPRYVRFAFSSVVTSSLYNSAGLPASTFTSEPLPIR